jgi:hypothetical protein
VKGLRLAAAAVCTGLAITVLATGQAPRAVADDSSAVTVAGSGEFAGLRLRVEQTRNLINQVVRVSWSGATPTAPSTGTFNVDYVQLMQCWGDDPAGPDREQCQYGALYGDARGGPWAASRQTSYGAALTDPGETYVQAPGTYTPAYVPFHSVTGKTVTGALNEFYDAYSSNEVPFGRTGADGTGQEFFEVQTAREAPGLGCGERLSLTKGRRCWLVAVPRGETEVNGLPAGQTPFHQLASSPLSAANWAHRIVVPLDFQPIGLACPIGSAERRTLGQESVAEAVVRWQPALCRTGSIFGYSQVSDDLARKQLATDQPGLAFVSQRVADDELAYAPVALSGLTIAFDIERQAARDAAPEVKAHNGERVTHLRLTARLVAKLLTQSYVAASLKPPFPGNPYDLTRDPDFLAVNPDFKAYWFNGIPDLVTPLGLSDATRRLWSWLHADPDARAFLAGKPDPWGMRLNPYYKGLELPRPDFPKSDPGCQSFGDGRPDLCTLDAHPYAGDMHEAARGAARGDTLSRNYWDPTATPPAWRKGPLQLSGSRAVIVLADSATAQRYSLSVASLRNASGAWTEPDSAGLLAGLAGGKGAYPLTTLTYAVTAPARLDAGSAKAYAAFVRYATADGQVPGTDAGRLSPGYVPLPAALRTEALAAAQRIATCDAARLAALAAHTPTAVPTADPTTAAAVAPPAAAPLVPAGAVTLPAPAGAHQPVPLLPQTGRNVPIAVATPTAPVPVGPSRYALASVLLLGGAASVAGPFLRRSGRGHQAARPA